MGVCVFREESDVFSDTETLHIIKSAYLPPGNHDLFGFGLGSKPTGIHLILVYMFPQSQKNNFGKSSIKEGPKMGVCPKILHISSPSLFLTRTRSWNVL